MFSSEFRVDEFTELEFLVHDGTSAAKEASDLQRRIFHVPG